MGFGLFLVSLGLGFLIHIFIEYPIAALINHTLIPELSYGRMIKIHQMKLLRETTGKAM